MSWVRHLARILRSFHLVGLGNLPDPKIKVGRVNSIELKPNPTITLDKIEYIINKFIIAHNFVLKIVFKISSKHCYKCDIVLFDKIDIFLEFCYVICYKDLLS